MKKIALFLAVAISIVVVSCKSDDDTTTTPQNVNVAFTFTQNWDGNNITNADYETTVYTNAHGTDQTISKLDYLISDITFTNSTGQSFSAEDYNLISARNGTNVNFTPDVQIPTGDYVVSFTFGFDEEDNVDAAYPDLTSATWGVPTPLGGGYHYMRLEGKFDDGTPTPANYAYHTIRAFNTATSTPFDTSFEVTIGSVTVSENTNVEVKMDVSEWFINPNEWDLNVLNSALMMNYNAQLMMSQNGTTVFSLGAVTQ
ncbi:MbnP family protein [Ulvibacter antarcticus]|uniref:Copper-binding protein MbnP-like domain-containing protein n=1 Tax=Ulvibacter antarcticus TaxID=442714 RepID=A0A3L9ZGF9_9FLAO|nr:MbnP family protein [Ulvibacter antarcticus]RMA65822.1 hypothetical protein BXY75_0235 [Ulvibacter antarcticus]